MKQTIVEKILSNHAGQLVKAGDIADIEIDVRVARDFGGANVVKNLVDHQLAVNDPAKTFFTFDCNPTGSDQKYAANQQKCRLYAREKGITVFDIDRGIGTHLAIDQGIASPGCTFVSTDSHANILGAIGAFGQGMGDVDIAHAFAFGRVWFEVPKTLRILLTGQPGNTATAKDIILAVLQKTGANGLLGYAAEFYGDTVDRLTLADRITMASMATEAGAIITFFPPNHAVLDYCRSVARQPFTAVYADADAMYENTIEVNIEQLQPMIARPGHPEDVIAVSDIAGTKIDSAFIGSCTNGRLEDMRSTANVLKGRKVAAGVVLKIVPATNEIWQKCLDEGLIKIFKDAGALVGNAGCAGCAAGQIGQNGPGEVTLSTGNRNFAGKQGKGAVYLASPATVAASAISGVITTADKIYSQPVIFQKAATPPANVHAETNSPQTKTARPVEFSGRVWIIPIDNIDTDMIFHNRYLTITDIKEMGQYTFDNLANYTDFAKKVKPGDILVTGKNFGAGSSRQQAVDCFESLGVSLIIAESFGAIYERNAINKGFPIMKAALTASRLQSGESIVVNIANGTVQLPDQSIIHGQPFSAVQLQIYRQGGYLQRPQT